MRLIAFAIAAVLGGCTTSGSALWPGPDWRTPVQPAAAAPSEPAPDAAAARDDAPTRMPRTLTRRSSSTPPDLLFPNPQTERRPQVVQPVSPPPVAVVGP
ncbi:MAG: hypothetical protein HY060_12985, partial [Proteobacteria bacterium]|nr:hypothetical protein [Pseudomonadota bacterium]